MSSATSTPAFADAERQRFSGGRQPEGDACPGRRRREPRVIGRERRFHRGGEATAEVGRVRA
jgi:hypothetical protein